MVLEFFCYEIALYLDEIHVKYFSVLPLLELFNKSFSKNERGTSFKALGKFKNFKGTV